MDGWMVDGWMDKQIIDGWGRGKVKGERDVSG